MLLFHHRRFIILTYGIFRNPVNTYLFLLFFHKKKYIYLYFFYEITYMIENRWNNLTYLNQQSEHNFKY